MALSQHKHEAAPRPLTMSREQACRVSPTNWRSSRAEARQKTTLLRRTVRRPGMGAMGLGMLVVWRQSSQHGAHAEPGGVVQRTTITI